MNPTQQFTSSLFMIDGKLNVEDRNIQLCFLIDSEIFEYAFINCCLILLVCDCLGIESMIMLKLKHVCGFDRVIAKQSLTHCLYLNIVLQKHKKLITSMFITDLSPYDAILDKLWMNQWKMLLDFGSDSIWFLNAQQWISVQSVVKGEDLDNNSITSQPSMAQFSSTPLSSALFSSSPLLLMSPSQILSHPQLIDEGNCIFSCCKIGVTSFAFLIKKIKSDGTVHLFVKFMREINNEIALTQETDTLDLSAMNEAEAKAVERELLNKLPPQYYEFKNVFD